MPNTKKAQKISPKTYRAESAERQRLRMRNRLLLATMSVCADVGIQPIAIGDVLKAAGVSRATFYTHFNSLTEAMAAVSILLSEEMYAKLLPFYADLDAPLERLAMSVQCFLVRTWLDPVWGRAFVAIGQISAKTVELRRQDLLIGRKSGAFQFPDVQAAADVHFGISMYAAKRLQTMTKGHSAYIDAVTVGALQAVGVSKQRAERATRWAAEDLRDKASLWTTGDIFNGVRPTVSIARTGKAKLLSAPRDFITLSGKGRRRPPG
jgi:AcrR family transcriptional regulator